MKHSNICMLEFQDVEFIVGKNFSNDRQSSHNIYKLGLEFKQLSI